MRAATLLKMYTTDWPSQNSCMWGGGGGGNIGGVLSCKTQDPFLHVQIQSLCGFDIRHSYGTKIKVHLVQVVFVILYRKVPPQRQRTCLTVNLMPFRPSLIARSLVMKWLKCVLSCPFIASRRLKRYVSVCYRISNQI